jgi:lysine-ketoglutarate reductase/saccharopine dehydrogenase-like protein (TIGR00300 family)
MGFKMPKYTEPNFEQEFLKNAPECKLVAVEKDGVAPEKYHALSIYPEYFKIEGKWYIAHESRMDCVGVFENGRVEAKEFRNLKKGDLVVVGRTEDASQGIYVYADGFNTSADGNGEVFAFRTGRSRETSFSKDYDELIELLKYEKKNNGHVVWVLGPAVSFDKGARDAVSWLVQNGHVSALMAGNALATHDLEGGYLKTALGVDIYSQEPYPMGHYNHLDLINVARKHGSIKALIENENIQDGIIYSCEKSGVPYVLAGSIRDDGPLPPVYANVYEAQDAMRYHTRRATTLISLATQLHTIASGNMTPSYIDKDGEIRPVYIYAIDTSEFILNKLRDRGTLEVTTMAVNAQDFVKTLKNGLE